MNSYGSIVGIVKRGYLETEIDSNQSLPLKLRDRVNDNKPQYSSVKLIGHLPQRILRTK